jgi:hypothetical protein
LQLYKHETTRFSLSDLEYLIFNINKKVLMATAIEFAIDLSKSFMPIPYITHNLSPIINTTNNQIETSSVFLFFSALII